jgi:methylaspartate mutase epsilon subunit
MLGGGVSGFNGAALEGCFSVEPQMKVLNAIENYQYVDRLLGWFQDQGVTFAREAGGFPSGTITPPCVSIVSSIIEALLAAEQGVKNIYASFPLNSCVIQDIAALQVERKLCKEYLSHAGFEDISYLQCAFQWSGPYPDETSQTLARICFDTIICAYAKVNKIIVKSSEEAKGVPSREGNAAGLMASRKILELMKNQDYPKSNSVEQEAYIIESQCRAIMKKVFEMGDGDVAQGTASAIERGFLDFPFSINKNNPNIALAARDLTGAVRFFQHGNLPFDHEAIQYEKEKFQERKIFENKDDLELIVEDLRAVTR